MTTNEFRAAQDRVLERYGVDADSRFVDVAVLSGRAHVLVSGQGPPVVMLNGVGTPAAMWAPLMSQLKGFTLYAVDLPGFGLTDTTSKLADDYRSTAVRFLEEVLEGLGLTGAQFVGNSLGSLWTLWLALDSPNLIVSMSHVGCPAIVLDTSAPLPMRLMSAPTLARIRQPTQLIWGKTDPFGTPTQGKRIAAALSNGVFHLVDGGHAPWLNNPDRVGQLVNDALAAITTKPSSAGKSLDLKVSPADASRDDG